MDAAAILPRSLAGAPALATDGLYWLIPMDAHPKLEQAGIRIKSSKNPQQAIPFTEFLAGPEGADAQRADRELGASGRAGAVRRQESLDLEFGDPDR